MSATKSQRRWQRTALAAATAALAGLLSSPAMALSLGRVLVQSALGEPLRAEIEILDINAEEAASLKTAIAGPDAFRAAGLDYHPALSGVKLTLERRANGQAYLRMSSDRAINDPFVDMILEASWSSGRIVRDYTMLFDPPNLRPSTAVAGSAPAPVTAPQMGGLGAASRPATTTSPSTAGSPSARPPVAVAARPAPAAPAPAAKRPLEGNGQQITVKAGDTASKIAASIKPASVSLDQMLVAMLRGNPDAFLGGNINRIKAGAVLNVPTEQQVQASSAAEATQTVLAQSKDFNDYRRKLAGTTPLAQVAPADRKASGSVQAKVEEKKPSAGAPDKLTLSKGAIQAKTAEDNLAKERAAKDAAARTAELSKNLADLNKVAAAAGAAAPAAKASAEAKPATPAVAVPAPAAPAVSAAPAASSAAPLAAASKPPAPVKKPVVAAPPPPEPSMLDELLENPLMPIGGGVLVLALGGFAVYRARKNKKTAPVDSAYLESRLQPDSFFGASGGQQVDTNDGNATSSSMVYSPSQLDAADDVDPVAEADVYLAYGRDMQAEEILKEALRTNPQRLAIHQKLLEIYAKRRDAKSFENIANQAYKLTSGEGPDWQRICEQGLSFDPSNPLYQPGGAPFGGSESKLAALDVSAVLDQPAPAPAEGASPVDLDLDLDFSLDDAPAAAATATPLSATPATEQTVRMQAAGTPDEQTVRMKAAEPEMPPMPTLDLEFGDSVPGAIPPAPTPAPAAAAEDNGMDFDLPELPQASAPAADNALGAEDFEQQAAVSFGSTAPAPLADDGGKSSAPKEPDTGMLEFDLGSLSLDLGDSTEGTSLATPAAPEDPLSTKLALAEEFNAIGDADGARALIEEVVAEATGDMKAKAQRALAAL